MGETQIGISAIKKLVKNRFLLSHLLLNWQHTVSNSITERLMDRSITSYGTARNFCWKKISPNPAYLCIAEYEIFSGINFRPCGWVHHRLYVLISVGQKLLDKFSPVGVGSELKFFLPAKGLAILIECKQKNNLNCGLHTIRIKTIPRSEFSSVN